MASSVPALHLIVGDEELLLERALARVVAAAREQDPDAGVHELAPSEVSVGTLTEVMAPSLFGDRRVVVLRSAQDLTKEPAAAVTAHVRDLADDVVLVLVHAGGAKGKALLEAATTAGAVRTNCPKPTKDAQRLDFIRAEFEAAGRKVTREGAQALLDAVGSGLRDLAAACAQLASDTQGAVDAAAVARYHAGRAEVTGFTVADHVAEGRLREALEALRWSLSVRTAPVLINSALARSVRGLAVVSQPQRGLGDAELAKRAGVPPWKLKTLRQLARSWAPAGIARALAIVAETDAQIKGAGRDPAYALERAVLDMVAARRG
jgi:DNA polymerase III delta subunit